MLARFVEICKWLQGFLLRSAAFIGGSNESSLSLKKTLPATLAVTVLQVEMEAHAVHRVDTLSPCNWPVASLPSTRAGSTAYTLLLPCHT